MLRKLTPPQLAFDIVVAALFLLVCWGLGAARGAGMAGLVQGGLVPVFLAAAAAFWRLGPGYALLLAWAGALIQVLSGGVPELADAAILVVLFATAAWGSRAVQWLGFASAIVGAGVATISLLFPSLMKLVRDYPSFDVVASEAGRAALLFAGILAVLLLSWALGLIARLVLAARDRGRAAAAQDREMAAEQERSRIARDMHDVVAHSLAVVVAQADGARYAGRSDPAAMEAALGTIATTAREALADVRVLLAQLRHRQGDAPQPTIEDLGRLTASMRASGLLLREETTGTPGELGTGQQLALYRIVQESLTNALRHADLAREVLLRLDWSASGLGVRVSSALPPGRAVEGSGHGLAGMRERASLAGGRLVAERRGGEFVVDAWLPAHAPARAR